MAFLVLLVIQVFIFAALVVFLRHLLKRHLGTASSHLEVLSQDYTAKLAEAKKRMEEANAFYDQALSKSKEEGERLKLQLIDEGVRTKQEMLEQARKQSEEIVEKARAAAASLREDLANQIDHEAVRKAEELLERLLTGKMAEETHRQWVHELLKSGFESLNCLHVPGEIKEANLFSAYPLRQAEKTLLVERLKQKLGRDVTLKEEVRPELVLGIRLSVGNVVVDGTLRYKIQEVLRHAQTGNT